MRYLLGILVGLVVYLSYARIQAQTVDPVVVPNEVMVQLIRDQIAIKTINEMVQHGEITSMQRDPAVARYVAHATEIAGQPMTAEKILGLEAVKSVDGTVQLSWFQRALGAVTLVNFFLGVAIVGFVIFLVWGLAKLGISAEFWEVSGYVVAAVLYWYASTLEADVAQYVTFGDTFLFAAMLAFTKFYHNFDEVRLPQFFLIVLTQSVIACLTTGNDMIGFISCLAFVGMIGTSSVSTLFLFDEDDFLLRAAIAGFTLLGFFVLTQFLDTASFGKLGAFRTGAVWVGSLVGYSALWLAAMWWFTNSKERWVVLQVVFLGLTILGMYLATSFGVPVVQRVAGTVFCFYWTLKLFEIPSRASGRIFVGALGFGVATAILLHVRSHMDLYAPYLLWGG